MAIKTDRQLVEIARKRVPLTKILHNKEIREAMAALEKFRQQFNEQEFFYGAKVYLTYSQGEAIAVVKRLETDKEHAERIERLRAAEEAKLERKRIQEEKNRVAEAKRQERLAIVAEQKRLADIAYVKKMARDLGLSAKELSDLVS